MDFLPRGNDALNVNPPIGVQGALSVHGSNFLWAVTAIYALSFVSPSAASYDAHTLTPTALL